ncbi:MAG TPA: Hsp20/alpha crystallin family protein, partial [Candidatus Marinimicrobia bacterium]|nr:Hsp20/alpha crystallin family protein [Candidatus Neomarinimicrobiota bacterium]
GVLTINGEKRAESSDGRNDYAYRESRQGKFSRSFRLPEEVNDKKIGASYTSGVLSVSVPRSKPIEVKGVEVQIK